MGNIQITSKKPLPDELGRWLTWILELPRNDNPAEDPTGERAAVNNGREEFWSVAGAVGQQRGTVIKRKITVPANREILCFAAESDAGFLEYPKAKKADDLFSIASAIAQVHQNAQIEIGDGSVTRIFKKDAKGSEERLELVEAKTIPVRFPPENVYKATYHVRGGFDVLSACGWGIKFILDPGSYTLRMTAEHPPTTVSTSIGTINIPDFYLNVECEVTAAQAMVKLPLK